MKEYIYKAQAVDDAGWISMYDGGCITLNDFMARVLIYLKFIAEGLEILELEVYEKQYEFLQGNFSLN